jgi:hypothetical protein
MKRFNDLELYPKIVFEHDEDEGYWYDVTNPFMLDICRSLKKKQKLTFKVEAKKSISVNGHNVTLEHLHDESSLMYIFENMFDESDTFSAKVKMIRGKELNKRLLVDHDLEEEVYFDIDCPACGHLLQEDEHASSQVASGMPMKCSNLFDCDYKDYSKVTWKPFDLEAAKAHATAEDIDDEDYAPVEWIDVDHPIVPEIAKEYPSIFFFDIEMFEKIYPNYEEELDDEFLDILERRKVDRKCGTCSSLASNKLHGLIAYSRTTKTKSVKNYIDNVAALYHCKVCGRSDVSSHTGRELEDWFEDLGADFIEDDD